MNHHTDPTTPTTTNRLIHESSPYLQKHAHDPVEWFAWGTEAFAKAKSEDKPLHLSVGYYACHWCTVLHGEAFVIPEIAAYMNTHFVNIKVDREERPDIDAIYMQAVQALTGHGGWPMTVFLTPDAQPFYGGTYFPPAPRYGLPSFQQLLEHMHTLWTTQRAELLDNAGQLMAHLQATAQLPKGATAVDTTVLDAAYRALQPRYDDKYGGWGQAPKFPQPSTGEFALRQHLRTGDAHALAMVEHTLDRMARGGLYDQLGGGFHRYSTDERWLVPHFEKMLYDNAQLARLYLHAWQVTGKAAYRRVVEETLDYVVREMTAPDGGFYATQDADSEGEEGKFFVWTANEVRSVLGNDALRWMQLYDVTPRGNWEGHTILNQPRPLAEVARVLGMTPDALETVAARGRAKLWAVREQRIRPGRDEKVLTAWNGLMLAAFAEAGRVLGREDYLAVGRHNAAFVQAALQPDGALLHVWKDGEAKIGAFAEDYALYADGLLALFQATGDFSYLAQARTYADELLAHFWDEAESSFFQTSDQAEALISRPKHVFDEAVPSSNGVAASVLHRLAVLYDDERFRQTAQRVAAAMSPALAQYPTALGSTLVALDEIVATPQEVVIIGERDQADTQAMLAALNRRHLPHVTVVVAAPDAPEIAMLPLLAERSQRDGKATAYVCRAYSCQQPTTDAAEMERQLG